MLLGFSIVICIFGIVALIGLCAYKGYKLYQSANDRTLRNDDPLRKQQFIAVKHGFYRLLRISILASVLLIAVIIICSSGAYIGPTDSGVVENGMNGRLSDITEGIHFWPKDSGLVPFASKVTNYSLRQIEILVGEGDIASETTGIEARSTSAGNPKVYYNMRALIQLNPKAVLSIHRQYGPNYIDLWVKKSFISAVKTVQGALPYDAVYDRKTMELKIKEAFSQKLQIAEYSLDQQALNERKIIQAIEVVQVDIVDYNFEKALDDLLTTIKDKEFQRQQAEKDNEINLVRKAGELAIAERQLKINENQQAADKISSDTAYYVQTKAGEAEAENVRKTGKAQSDNIREIGKAEADIVREKKLAEAEGVKSVIEAMANANQNFIWYNALQSWGGKIPEVLTIGGEAKTFQVSDLFAFATGARAETVTTGDPAPTSTPDPEPID